MAISAQKAFSRRMGELPASLVEHLNKTKTFPAAVEYRHVEQVASAEPGNPINFRIETRVGIGVGYIKHVSAGERRTSDPDACRYANLISLTAFGDFRAQLVLPRVLDEKRRPLGIEKLRRRRHDAGEQGIEVQLGGDCLGDRQQLELLLPGLFEPLHQMHLLERARGVAIDRLEKGGIDLGTGP